MRNAPWLPVLALALSACAVGDDNTPTDASRDHGSESAADAPSDGSSGDDASGDGASGDDATLDAPADDAPGDATAMDSAATDGARDATGVDGARDAGADSAADAPDVCVPATEVCNGRDDNCDGRVDETGCPGHLLINEIVAFPNEAEFIEIYNPTAAAVDLGNVYVTDFHRYAESVAQSMPALPGSTDFVARFPAGASIPAHGYQTVATGNPSSFATSFGGMCPTYYLQSTATVGACSASHLMRPLPTAATSIGTTASLTNAGEPVTLFQWDGASDLVQDIDYVYYGSADPATNAGNPVVDKSMLSVDGPDPDTVTSGYHLDTPAASQQQARVHVLSAASIRCDEHEGTEVLSGGNGVFGHNETSENLATTWAITAPTVTGDAGTVSTYRASPNAANPCP